jgi:hypothetical protein
MRRPSFQFYPADWRNNANLRRCSWEARGVWIEIMGLMHDSDTYGVLQWPLKEIAQALGAPVKLVQELASKGVMKGADKGVVEAFVYTPRSGRKDLDPKVLIDSQDGPLWYSSRMVKDEHLRSVRGESTRFGDDTKDSPNATSKVAPKGGLGAQSGDGSTSSSSSTTSPSLRSGEDAPKASATTLKAYLERCRKDGCKPIPPGHPLRAYCADAGISEDMLQVAWLKFRDRYTQDEKAKLKRYKDWPRVFQNSVEGRWFGLWIVAEEGDAQWSTNGLQQKRVIEAQMRKREEAHATA